MPLPGPINHAHSAPSDFFQNLIIAHSPVGIAHFDFAEHIIERFTVVAVGVQTLREQTAQTKTASDTRCRSTLRASDRFLSQTS